FVSSIHTVQVFDCSQRKVACVVVNVNSTGSVNLGSHLVECLENFLELVQTVLSFERWTHNLKSFITYTAVGNNLPVWSGCVVIAFYVTLYSLFSYSLGNFLCVCPTSVGSA